MILEPQCGEPCRSAAFESDNGHATLRKLQIRPEPMNKNQQTFFSVALSGLLLLAAGCSVTPSSQEGDKVAAKPPAAEPSLAPEKATAAAPAAPVIAPVPRSEPPKAEKPVAKPAAKPAATAQKPQAAVPATPAAPAPAPLALDTLEQRLKDTPAIGVFTKLTLKNQVDELVDRFRDHHAGRGGASMSQLRQSFEQLLGKVQSLLKDGDPNLATAIAQSREAIWSVLTDPAKFAKL